MAPIPMPRRPVEFSRSTLPVYKQGFVHGSAGWLLPGLNDNEWSMEGGSVWEWRHSQSLPGPSRYLMITVCGSVPKDLQATLWGGDLIYVKETWSKAELIYESIRSSKTNCWRDVRFYGS
jgi:hypothetical protein